MVLALLLTLLPLLRHLLIAQLLVLVDAEGPELLLQVHLRILLQRYRRLFLLFLRLSLLLALLQLISLPPTVLLLYFILYLFFEDVSKVPRFGTHAVLPHLCDLLFGKFDLIAAFDGLLWLFACPPGLDGPHELKEGS